METSTRTPVWHLDLIRGLVLFLGLHQGGVPLVVRLLFGADQRFAPALWLPAPWWWIACVAIVIVMGAALAVLREARRRRLGDAQPDADDVETVDGRAEDGGDASAAFDAASGLVFLVGIYNGVAPFVVRLFGRDGLLLSLPTRLAAPWWWITSLIVLAATVALLAWMDHRKQQHRAASARD